MRWDSPLVLAFAGTTAIHLILIVAGDAIVVFNPIVPHEVAPHIELVDVELPPVVKPLPPPPEPPPVPEPVHEDPKPVPTTHAAVATHHASTPQQIPETPQTHDDQPPTPGGEQVVTEENIAPSATGVGVAQGKPHPRIGRGGTGAGTGEGSGSGSAEAPPPVSVATIKTLAKPRGDYGYLAAGNNYPTEARQLGIEGVIKVKLIVDAAGRVTRKVLLTHLGHGLDDLALDQAGKIEFDPARDTDDHAVASVVVWTFNMTLPK